MNTIDFQIAKELKRRLRDIVSVVDIRVFGSRARGDNQPFSDMDVYIEVEELEGDMRDRIYDVVWEVGFENCIVVAALICTRSEVEDTPFRASPILKNIFEEGVVI